MPSTDLHDEEGKLLRALAAHDLLLFATLAFPIIEPGKVMLESWHTAHLAYLLEQLAEDRERRLIVNQPPRSLKSILVSVIFVAFLMGNDPTLRVIVSSHTKELARKLASDFRRLISSPLYKQIFPGLVLAHDGDTIGLQRTSLNGHRIATSVGATITGHGADLIIVDDPNRAKDIYSEAHRRKVNTYFDQELSSRLNDKIRGKIIVVMQRLHEDDLTGHLLARGGAWSHSIIQARADEQRSYRIGYGAADVHHTEIGDILLPEMNTEESLGDLRAVTGSINFEAQYQQQPSPADGVIIKRDWLRYYDRPSPLDRFDFILISWDLASTISESSDYSVGTVWGLQGQHFHLIDVIRGRYEAPQLRRLITSTHERYEAHQTIIEKAGIGDAIGAEMRQQGRIRPILVSVANDKTARLIAQSPKFEAEQVILPREAPWLGTYLNELLAFPNSRNDDQVDSTSQALKFLTRKMPPPVRSPRSPKVTQRPHGKVGRLQ